MTRKQIKAEIAALKRAEQTIYDYRRRHHLPFATMGLAQAGLVLCRKRIRLEKKLK